MKFVIKLRSHRARIWGYVFFLWLCFIVATPKISPSPTYHVLADMRNFFGVPNTMNVLTNFPFLIVGIVGLVLSLHGSYLGISLRGEIWAWVLFYVGITVTAFGSAYYHLKPEDSRILWDQLPMMVALVSLFSCFIIERINENIGVTSLFFLLTVVLISAVYERTFNDLRLCMMFHLIPCVTIPAMSFLFPPKYTLSKFWFWASGLYFLAKLESLADKKIYHASHYIISGHSLEHLCLVMVPIVLTLMLWFRNIEVIRLGELEQRP